MRIAHKWCQFVGGRPITKRSLEGEQCTFMVVFWLPFEGFSWNSLLITMGTVLTNAVSLVAIGQ